MLKNTAKQLLRYGFIFIFTILITACNKGSITNSKTVNSWYVTTLAGSAVDHGSADGTGAAARFNRPFGITSHTDGNFYVTDGKNHTIRKITPTGVVTTVAGSAGDSGSADGTGAAARFNEPFGITSHTDGNLYVTDYWNYTIRKITPAGVVTTVAGSAGHPGSADGTGAAAWFTLLYGITSHTDGNLYVTDYYNRTIRKITPAGVVTTLAGSAGHHGSADGTGEAARFSLLHGITSHTDGNLYVTSSSHAIRKITTAGVVTTVAGSAGDSGNADGIASAARFNDPLDITSHTDGNLYVTDYANHTIRKVTPAGEVTTVAGKAGGSGSTDGTSVAARFNKPVGITSHTDGNLYVADSTNHTIRKMVPQYKISGLASGLTGGLVLQNNDGDDLTVDKDGDFSFATRVLSGDTYNVTVSVPPEGQTCSVINGGGIATSDVTNVEVRCTVDTAATYSIGGSVFDLAGTGLELQNNGGDNLPVDVSGGFTFDTLIVSDSSYEVTVLSQPVGQTCTVTDGNGTATSNVSNVMVSCTTNSYTIGGSVSGLTGGTLILQNNGDDLNVVANGIFTFVASIVHASPYNVTVSSQPAGQTCTVTSGGSGTATSNVTNVMVVCTADVVTSHTIGGVVNNLQTVGLTLQNNLGDNLDVFPGFPAGDPVPFDFITPVNDGGGYSVTVLSQPAGQTCTVTSGGSGIATSNVADVVIDCI